MRLFTSEAVCLFISSSSITFCLSSFWSGDNHISLFHTATLSSAFNSLVKWDNSLAHETLFGVVRVKLAVHVRLCLAPISCVLVFSLVMGDPLFLAFLGMIRPRWSLSFIKGIKLSFHWAALVVCARLGVALSRNTHSIWFTWPLLSTLMHSGSWPSYAMGPDTLLFRRYSMIDPNCQPESLSLIKFLRMILYWVQFIVDLLCLSAVLGVDCNTVNLLLNSSLPLIAYFCIIGVY